MTSVLRQRFLLVIACIMCATAYPTNPQYEADREKEKDPEFWRKWAKQTLQQALNQKPNTNVAKNVILLMGDGNSLTTIFATRVLKGQMKGDPGEEAVLAYENFPNVALAKTYDVSHQISDSAATATAYLCGTKVNYATIGVSAKTERGNCTQAMQNKLENCMAEIAQSEGKSTGYITTARVSHASPAPLYASTPERNWEDDRKLTQEIRDQGCKDIAVQLLDPIGLEFNVVMGGGRQKLMPSNETDPEYPSKNGTRTDGRNVIREWLNDKKEKGKKAAYVWKKDDFDAINPAQTDHLMGVFEPSHMRYANETDEAGEPSLAQMVEKAIKIMQRNNKGFFLFVEGARIDHAHHDNWAKRALVEGLAFEEAVQKAVEMTSVDDTLIIVTADHSHGMVTASYPYRGNDILGLTDYSDDRVLNGLSDTDHMPYTTILYSAGPGYVNNTKLPNGQRRNLTDVDIHDDLFEQQANIPLKYVPHDGSDVTIYARGPMSHLFHSTHEQNYIYHVMAYAACMGDDKRHCARKPKPKPYAGSAPQWTVNYVKIVTMSLFVSLIGKIC